MVKLISITDFTENKSLTQNLAASDIDPIILEAQQFDIKPILGDEQFFDFMANLTATKYVNLFNGQTYTPNGSTNPIRFEGLKMVLKYYVYARLLVADGVKSTNSGFVLKTLENSERISGTQKTQMIAQTRSGAKAYEDDMRCYLSNFSSLFPLYGCGTQKNKGYGFRMKAI